MFLLTVLTNRLPVSAYSKTLSQDEIASAIEYGKTRKSKDIADVGSPYFPNLSDRVSAALIYTPWLKVAELAREKAATSVEPTAEEIQNVVQVSVGKLEIHAIVAHFIPREALNQELAYWSGVTGSLVQGQTRIQPSQKEGRLRDFAGCNPDGQCATIGIVRLVFADEQLNTNDDVDLVITPVRARELRARVKLGTLR